MTEEKKLTVLEQHLQQRGYALPDLICGHVGGRSIAPNATATRLPIYFPGSGEHIVDLQEDGPETVKEAVAVAEKTFREGSWSQCAVSHRQAVLREAARALREQADLLALEECLCAGLPSSHLASRQVPRAADNLDFYADYIGQMAGETYEQMQGYRTVVTRQPVGVAALFAPWNAPLALSSMQIASSIAFGNSCVMKPSEFTPLSILRLVAILESAGVPPGVINIVNGRGAVTGASLAGSDHVARIAFTGGGHTAQQVMAAAANNLTPVHFELGGKSANIVFDDADFDRALDGSLVNIFSNSGQICIAGSRVLVHQDIASRFIPAFVERARQLQVGNPLDPQTEVGPMAFAAHQQRVLAAIKAAEASGAQKLCGDQDVSGLGDGYFVAPTVFQVSDNSLAICQEEVFGPVVTIQAFETDEQAWSIANDSRYGLVGYCWTESLGRAQAFQQRVDAGTLWINTPLARDLRAPFGGFKASGIGRDGPRQAADFFTEEKATISALGKTPIRKLGLGDRPQNTN